MKKSVALVLGSGGARGVAHIGVIEALEDNGFEISSIAGSSMGAVVGGIYAAGKLKEYKDWVCNFDKIDVFKLLDFTFSLQGFVRGEKVFKEMEKLLGNFNIEELNIPFAAVASNVRTQKEVVFREGGLMEALRASCAIPTVLTPVYHNNEEIVDGGVLNPIPINQVQRHQGDLLVVVDVNASIPYETKQAITVAEQQEEQRYSQLLESFRANLRNIWPVQPKEEVPKKFGYFDLLNRSVDLMQSRITQLQIDRYQPEMLVQISRDSCGTFEFYKGKEIVEAGKAAFEKSLAHYKYEQAGTE